MVERHFAVGFWRAGSWYRAGLGLVVAAGLCALPTSAQGGLFSRHKADSEPQQQAKPGLSPSQPPAFAIPVEPLGFFAPGAFYQGQRESLVSLDFLDEDRLLFTSPVPTQMVFVFQLTAMSPINRTSRLSKMGVKL